MNERLKIIACTFLLLIYFSLNIQAQDAAKSPTVKITALNEYGQDENGTGIILGHSSNILFIATAAHVVPTPDQIKISLFQGPTLKGEVVKMNTTLDLATLKCTIPKGYKLPASFAITKSEEKALQSVIIVGHPLGNDWDINYNTNVKATEFDLDDRLFTLAPIGITPGNSGGPVLNQQYELLGLVQNVDQVKAVCVDIATLMKACRAWEVPTNLLTGIDLEEKKAEAGEEDFRYKLFLQEANTAFAAQKWEQAKKTYAELYALTPQEEIQAKIRQCELEMAKDRLYQEYFTKGKNAASLESSIGFFEKARSQRDTKAVREKLRMTRERLAKLNVQQDEIKSNAALKDKMIDPILGELILVRGGTFMMGSDQPYIEDEFPSHRVLLSDFYMAAREITVVQWCEFVNEMYLQAIPLEEKEKWEKAFDEWRSITAVLGGAWGDYCIIEKNITTEGSKTWVLLQLNPREGKENFPMAGIHKQDALNYCKWLSSKHKRVYRLPTEAEWEYAARGGQKSKKYKYAGSNIWKDLYVYRSAEEVDSRPPNELGIFHMSSNVSEWVSDLYASDYYLNCKARGTVSDPKGPDEGEYLCRGGHFGNIEVRNKQPRDYQEYQLSVTTRFMHTSKSIPTLNKASSDEIGLRVVLSPYEQYRDAHQRGALGVRINDIDSRLAGSLKLNSQSGVIVTEAVENGAAKKAGIIPNDVIIQVNEYKVKDVLHFTQFISSLTPGKKVKIKIIRAGKEQTLNATLKSMASN